MAKARIGLIGIIHEESKKDFWGTMQKVAQIGYEGIEGAPPQLLQGDVKENLKRFHDLGLKVLCTSASREQLRDSVPALVQQAKVIQAPRVSCWWGPCDSRESVLRDAELYNAAGAKLSAEGLKLCYHNHGHEFRNIYDGVYSMDILAEHTDPKVVFFEVDVAWVTFGGEDPLKVIRKMAGRIPALHIKDLAAVDTEKAQFTAVGTGVVNVTGSVQAGLDTGVEWFVIEQDRLRNLDPIQTITVSYLNLKEAGLA